MEKDNISENIEEYLEVLYRNGSIKEPGWMLLRCSVKCMV